MAGDGLGMSGPGAGMFNRLFDAGLDIGVSFGRQALGVQPGANQATRLGLTEPQLAARAGAGTLTVSNETMRPNQNMTLLIVAVVIGAVLLAKS